MRDDLEMAAYGAAVEIHGMIQERFGDTLDPGYCPGAAPPRDAPDYNAEAASVAAIWSAINRHLKLAGAVPPDGKAG